MISLRTAAAALAGEALILATTYLILRPEGGSRLNIAVGSLGLLSMVAMMVYSVARRSVTLRRWAPLSAWLKLHIFLGLQGILLVSIHSLPPLWRTGARPLLNPGLMSMVSVLVVFTSGVFGRYLFAFVPRTIDGRHVSVAHSQAELEELSEELPEAARRLLVTPPDSLVGMTRFLLQRRQRRAVLRAQLADPALRERADRALQLHGLALITGRVNRVFRWWIVIHRAIAVAIFILAFGHTLLGLMFSPKLGAYGW